MEEKAYHAKGVQKWILWPFFLIVKETSWDLKDLTLAVVWGLNCTACESADSTLFDPD